MSQTYSKNQIKLRPGKSLDNEFVRTHCANKKGKYRSRKRAKGIAALATISHGVKFSAYKCPECGYWHLTTRDY